MLRLALIGDLHLDERSPRYRHVLEVLDWTLADAVAAGARSIVFLGDLCEGAPTPRVYADLLQRLMNLEGMTVGLVLGNHEHYEALAPLDEISPRFVTAWSCVEHLDFDEAHLVLIPYARRGRPPFHGLADDGTIAGSMAATARAVGDVVQSYRGKAAAAGVPLLVAGHFTIESMKVGNAEFELHHATEVVVPRSAFDGVALAAVGHVHSPQDVAPHIIGVGSLIRHSFTECEDVKSYTLVTVDQGQVTWERRVVPCRAMRQLATRWPTVPMTDAVIDHVRGAEVKLTVEIPEDQLATFDASVFDPVREAAAYFVLNKVTLPVQRTRAPEIAQAATLGDQVAAWLEATGQGAASEGLRAKVAEIDTV